MATIGLVYLVLSYIMGFILVGLNILIETTDFVGSDNQGRGIVYKKPGVGKILIWALGILAFLASPLYIWLILLYYIYKIY